MDRLISLLGDAMSLVTGFILPKFSLENSKQYLDHASRANQGSNHMIYIMPIFESPLMIPLHSRYQMLHSLKMDLDSVKDMVLNIRVGGNDLCHSFGFRRHKDEMIYDITPVRQILSDIVTTFGSDYVVSGPVWEYYRGENWDRGLKREVKHDLLNGFIGKTVIHPNQISIVNEALQVSKEDFLDACSILDWSPKDSSLVSGNAKGERMNELLTHSNWAYRIKILADIYGIRNYHPQSL